DFVTCYFSFSAVLDPSPVLQSARSKNNTDLVNARRARCTAHQPSFSCLS
ncbi:hypothetical protein LEMLEM_LOCUS11205, partial [Lemmus lemmus]